MLGTSPATCTACVRSLSMILPVKSTRILGYWRVSKRSPEYPKALASLCSGATEKLPDTERR